MAMAAATAATTATTSMSSKLLPALHYMRCVRVCASVQASWRQIRHRLVHLVGADYADCSAGISCGIFRESIGNCASEINGRLSFGRHFVNALLIFIIIAVFFAKGLFGCRKSPDL